MVFPEDAVEGEPVGGHLHGAYGEAAHADAAGLFLFNEASLLEDVEVFEDGGHGDIVRACKFGDRGVAAPQGGEDGSTRGIAKGGEGHVEGG